MSHTGVKDCWAEEVTKIIELKKVGAEHYIKSIPNWQNFFQTKDRGLRCIDEGTPGGVHLAGSGILMNIDEAERCLKEAGVDGLYSHEECGAAKLFAKQEGLDPEYADEYCQEWVKSLAERLKIPYKGHIDIDQMTRPAGLHIASAVYYDGTGSFDNSKESSLPAGFVISRRYLNIEYAKKELGVALSIAFGGHGFGGNFTPDTPFVVIIFSRDKNELAELQKEAEEVAQEYGQRVQIELVKVD